MAKPAKLDVYCYRYPLAEPLRTVFGDVRARPAVLVRLEDDEGAEGWGEIWCNFPQPGAEYRARLAGAVAPGALAGIDLNAPDTAFKVLRAKLHRIALQAGEPGPADQIASGLDIAVHDLAARRAGVPIATLLGGAPRALTPYASGIDSRDGAVMVQAAREAGYRAFKLRIGFAGRNVAGDVGAVAEQLGDGEQLMVDANQAWDCEEAVTAVRALEGQSLRWVEEPLPVDATTGDWRAVADASPFAIAGGENMRSDDEFQQAINGSVFGVIQPDICKWGGLSECVRLARAIVASGKTYCPHYLGGGVGLAASAHLLAAVGGDGLLEVDVNDNGLREALAGPLLPLSDGDAVVADAPGLGYVPDVDAIADLLTHRETVTL